MRVKELTERAERLETTLGRMEILANQLTPNSVAPAPADPLADLERLAGLKAKGMLSEDEFDQTKRTLLARWLT
jgi:hypothetical protein